MTNDPAHSSALLTTEQAAQWLGISVHTLYRWGYEGYGPPYLRLRRAKRYRLRDLEAWAEAQMD